MKKSGAVVGQAKRGTIVPFVCYMVFSALLLPPTAMKSYGGVLQHYGGLSIHRVLGFFQGGCERMLTVLQTAFFHNFWQEKYVGAEARRRELEFEIVDLKRKIKENRQLREVLALGESIEWQYLNAEIIVLSGSSLQDSIAIDVGSQQGVYRDAPVIGFAVGSYGLIGKVKTVGRQQSTVVSLVNRYYQLGVTAMLEKSRFQGILSGNGRLYRLDFISRQALRSIERGDLVVSAGSRESLYPRGIPIGYIQEVEELEYNASLSLTIRPVVELSQLEYVAVLLEHQQVGALSQVETENKPVATKANNQRISPAQLNPAEPREN